MPERLFEVTLDLLRTSANRASSFALGLASVGIQGVRVGAVGAGAPGGLSSAYAMPNLTAVEYLARSAY